MRGFDLHHHMAPAEFVGAGCTTGILLALGRYPGLIDGAGLVRGELYRFENTGAALDVLDDVEDYDPLDPENSLYVRVTRSVRDDAGRDVTAWTYLYNRTGANAQPVPNGDWRSWNP